jgi:adenylyltransferase/sulfurtransferase
LADYDALCAAPAAAAKVGEVLQITATELDALRSERRSVALLDVREPWEWDVARISGATLIPLGELPRGVAALDRSADTVVYCHHGVRAQAAAERLVSLGFRRVYNLAGGIDAWSTQVDTAVPRY